MSPWVIAYTMMILLSLIGQIVIIYLYAKQKKSKTSNTSQDLLLRMAISDIFFCLGQIIIIYPNNRSSQSVDIRCDIQSILTQFGALSLCFNCFCLCYFSYFSFSNNEEITQKYSFYSLGPCYVIPLILALITHSLGDSSANEYTCLVSGLENGQGAIEFFTTFYVPLIIFMGLNLLYVLKSIIYVNQLKIYNNQECLQLKAAQEILQRMQFYPLIFLISWLGFIIARVKFMITQGKGSLKDEGILVVLNDSQGFLNSIVYIYNYYSTRKLFQNPGFHDERISLESEIQFSNEISLVLNINPS